MLEVLSEELDRSSTKVRLYWQGASIASGAAFELCKTDSSFRGQLIEALAGSSFVAYFWEMPAVTMASLNRPFEFVLTEATALAKATADSDAFREYFDDDLDRDGIVVFENLGRDATLFAPCPLGSKHAYVHLAAFLRLGPESQRHALLRSVASEVLSRATARPLWLSTAGTGVYWLHVRLDLRPKYFQHAPYKLP
jgi:hypothetical protein